VAKTRIRITTPYPTVDDVAKTFRIPPGRVKKIVSMVDEIIQKLEREKKAAKTPRRKLQRPRRSKV
jgi:hypothetical protein